MMVHIKPRVSFGLLSTISSARMLTNLICIDEHHQVRKKKKKNTSKCKDKSETLNTFMIFPIKKKKKKTIFVVYFFFFLQDYLRRLKKI